MTPHAKESNAGTAHYLMGTQCSAISFCKKQKFAPPMGLQGYNSLNKCATSAEISVINTAGGPMALTSKLKREVKNSC